MADTKQRDSGYDFMLLIPAILLVGLGLLVVYSASSNLAEHRMGDSYFYLRKQALFCAVGIGLMIIARYVPCILYSKLTYPFLIIGGGLLILLLIPGFGRTVGGACRWLPLGGVSFQPSEFAKFFLAVYLAYSMSKKGDKMGSFSTGVLPHLMVAGVFVCLILLQPDLGTAVIIGAWLMIMLFLGGVKVYQLAALSALFLPLVGWLVLQADYRLNRWMAFLDPWADPQGIGFHIIHSFLAFGSGGIFGVGLGNSKQKLFYLPEPHTDFALSIVGEELGLIGVAVVIILFGALIIRGIKVALNARDLYSSYLALGLTCFIALQVIINMGVVVGLLPTKGLPLPLISYGGSSLVITLASIGVLLNISARR
ncbi:MAG: putative lipid II flippase FtsW [Deltaproteobacteria bacterium]|jgi:cell division protein FtsW